MGVADVLRAKRVEVLTMMLPVTLLSKNVRDKMHWSQRRKLKQSYEILLRSKYPRRQAPTARKQHVTFTRILGKGEKLFDEANIGAGSCVELQDAMTACGFFIDDSPRYLSSEFRQDASTRQLGPAVMIEIEVL